MLLPRPIKGKVFIIFMYVLVDLMYLYKTDRWEVIPAFLILILEVLKQGLPLPFCKCFYNIFKAIEVAIFVNSLALFCKCPSYNGWVTSTDSPQSLRRNNLKKLSNLCI